MEWMDFLNEPWTDGMLSYIYSLIKKEKNDYDVMLLKLLILFLDIFPMPVFEDYRVGKNGWGLSWLDFDKSGYCDGISTAGQGVALVPLINTDKFFFNQYLSTGFSAMSMCLVPVASRAVLDGEGNEEGNDIFHFMDYGLADYVKLVLVYIEV
jgi:hypothetical protein